jgi:hypothetical protein
MPRQGGARSNAAAASSCTWYGGRSRRRRTVNPAVGGVAQRQDVQGLVAKPDLGTDLLPGRDQRPDTHVRDIFAVDLA